MRGTIKLGTRWVPFRARETLAPARGFVWAGSAGRVIRGADSYVDGESGLDWRLFGVIPVARASGRDAARSAAGRLAGEAVWLPPALLPRFGARWKAAGDGEALVTTDVDGLEVTSTLSIDDDGRLRAARFDRWGDPSGNGDFGWHRFGMLATSHRSFAGLTIPDSGRVGWHIGTDRWDEGEFFRYRITVLEPVGT